jgi:hypothetical protein
MLSTTFNTVRKPLFKVIAVATLASVFSVAHATTGTTSGQIGGFVLVTGAGGAPGDLDLRVSLVGSTVFCNSKTFAYLNQSDVNYQTTVANLLTARTAGISVAITWSQQTSGDCEITSIQW